MFSGSVRRSNAGIEIGDVRSCDVAVRQDGLSRKFHLCCEAEYSEELTSSRLLKGKRKCCGLKVLREGSRMEELDPSAGKASVRQYEHARAV